MMASHEGLRWHVSSAIGVEFLVGFLLKLLGDLQIGGGDVLECVEDGELGWSTHGVGVEDCELSWGHDGVDEELEDGMTR